MNLCEGLEQIRKNSNQMLWHNCDACKKKNYQNGFDKGYDYGTEVSYDILEEELLKLREYKNKVEKFISKYDGSIVLLPGEVVLTWNQCIKKLKEELGYD